MKTLKHYLLKSIKWLVDYERYDDGSGWDFEMFGGLLNLHSGVNALMIHLHLIGKRKMNRHIMIPFKNEEYRDYIYTDGISNTKCYRILGRTMMVVVSIKK